MQRFERCSLKNSKLIANSPMPDSESFHRVLRASPWICGGARHRDSVTLKESSGMSTEANFVFGNEMFLQRAAQTIFCRRNPVLYFEQDSVTVKESPGMSTEANFVFGNEMFL